MAVSGVGGVGQNPYQYFQTSASQSSSCDPNASDSSPDAPAQTQIQIQLQMQAQSAPHRHHHGGGHHGGASKLIDTVEQALQSADSSDDPNKVIEDAVARLLSGNNATDDANGSTASTGSTSATSGQPPANQSFADILKAHGVDAQQFRADLLAAVEDARNGQANPAAALQSLPPGSSVDVTA